MNHLLSTDTHSPRCNMFQTMTLAEANCRLPLPSMPEFQRPRVELRRGKPAQKMQNKQGPSDAGGGGYTAGAVTIFKCSGNDPEITLTWDNTGRITSGGVQSMRAGCSSTPGGS